MLLRLLQSHLSICPGALGVCSILWTSAQGPRGQGALISMFIILMEDESSCFKSMAKCDNIWKCRLGESVLLCLIMNCESCIWSKSRLCISETSSRPGFENGSWRCSVDIGKHVPSDFVAVFTEQTPDILQFCMSNVQKMVTGFYALSSYFRVVLSQIGALGRNLFRHSIQLDNVWAPA